MYETAERKITIMPAKPKIIQTNTRMTKLVVAAYARVSTLKEEQEESYETQIRHYTKLLTGNPEFIFAGMYADKGLTGTKVEKRPQFMKMINDARVHKIDRIYVKCVSRFGRNIAESIGLINEMRDLGVGITFESEGIDTLKPGYEVLLAVLTSIAEQEARNISENVRKHVRQRFEEGRFLYNFSQTLGYTKDDDGKYIIVPEEAEIVKRIYREYLNGYSIKQIANGLMKDEIKTPSAKEPYRKEWTDEQRKKMQSKSIWYASTIMQMLTNEKYKGCALCQKTFKVDVLSPRRKKNEGQLNQVYLENVIPKIITTDMWNLVQAEINKRQNLRTFAGNGVGKFSSKYAMSGVIICAECGSKYRRHARYSKEKGCEPTWVCINHKENGNEQCSSKYVLEDDIKKAYQEALKELAVDIIKVKEELLVNIKLEIDDRLDEELLEIAKLLEESQKEMLELTMSLGRRDISEKTYNEKVIAMSERMEGLVNAQREGVHKRDTVKLAESRIKEIAEILESMSTDEYDEEIFKTLVETIEITKEHKIKIKFKCGKEVEKLIP